MGVITRKQIDSLINKYEKQQKEIQNKLELIRNGAEFGEYATDYGCDEYYPSKFLKVIDEETGLIKYEEHGVRQRSVLDLFVVGYQE